ncbi:hypothetical protein Acr_13g0004150 [Actinidia rufa]|uniref:Uncharacterized protein n=1 Tax=Actinidia rufa TaxID=165716 RepID=A0A7J0FJY7_9ERIC|nr:hypothetical protein Acr_13g0004150 [Actinidia rufa]
MTDLSPSLEIQNPNSTQDDECQKSISTPISSTPNPRNLRPPKPEQSEIDRIQNYREEEEKADPQVLDLEGDQQNHQDPDDRSGMSSSYLSPPPLSLIPPITDPQPPLTSPSNVSRRPNKRKKGGKQKQQAIEKKVQTLTQNLKPIPFVPSKTLNFDKHQKLLKRLGLWDFVHVQFDPTLRLDLIAQLIVNYDQKSRCSYVNELRVAVNRADLARAFKLPVKKDKGGNMVSEAVDLDSEEVLVSEESIAFIEEFVSNWVLLHEDTWILPNEVLNWTRAIKDRHPEKVDWAGLIWFMVEKELMQGKLLEDCYYASHLQYLIKSQREEMFWEEQPKLEPEVEVKVKEEDDCVEVKTMGQEPEVEVKVKEEDDCVELKTMGQEPVGEVKVKEEDDCVEVKTMGQEPEVEVKVKEEEDCVEVKTMVQEPEVEAELKVKEEEEDGKEVTTEQEHMEGVEGVAEAEAEAEAEAVAVAAEAKEEEDGGEVKMGDFDDFQGHESEDNDLVEEPNVELTLGKEIVDKEEEEVKDGDMMDVEESEVEEQGQWLLDGKNISGDHFLQHCTIEADTCVDDGDEERKLDEEVDEEVDEDEDESDDDGFNLMSKRNTLEGDVLTGNLLHGMETAQIPIPFDLPGELRDGPDMELLSSRNSDGPSVFGNSSKREMVHEHDVSHDSLNGNNKRLRTDGSWSHKSSDFEMCMEEMHHWMEKARMTYRAKEQVCEESNMNQQFLLTELQRRDNVIDHLHKTKQEEVHKKDGEIYRLERELYLMGNLLEGYRKALKETHKAFSEYRQRCQLPEEPLYKDAGPGGVVLSAMELEKQRLKREEEDRLNRIVIEQQVKELEEEAVGKLEAHLNEVHRLDKRLMDFENEVKLMKELSSKPKVTETSESAPLE